MPLAQELLEILRCPESREELIYFPAGAGKGAGGGVGKGVDDDGGQGFLFCPASGLRYAIDEHGIPIMLIEEATRLDDDQTRELVARARELGLDTPSRAST